MTWQIFLDYGPMGIAAAVAWAVWKGHLVLGREFTDLKNDNTTLAEKLDTVTKAMESAQAKEREEMAARIESLKREIAELKQKGKTP